jgi:hypothetical protein
MLTFVEELCEQESEGLRQDPAIIISSLATAARAVIGREGVSDGRSIHAQYFWVSAA